jgi:hypothetical protein
LRALGLKDRNDPITEIFARKVIEVGKGRSDPADIAKVLLKILVSVNSDKDTIHITTKGDRKQGCLISAKHTKPSNANAKTRTTSGGHHYSGGPPRPSRITWAR